MHRVLSGTAGAERDGEKVGQPSRPAGEDNALNRLARRIYVVNAAEFGVIEAIVVEDQEIVGRGRRNVEERIVPLQDEEVVAGGSKDRKCDRDIPGSTEIVEASARELSGDISENEVAGVFRTGVGIADRVESPGVIAAIVVASGGKIGDPVSLDLVDRQGNDTVGEERLL